MKIALIIIIGIMVWVCLLNGSKGRLDGYSMGYEAGLRQLESEFREEIAQGTDFLFLNHLCYGLKEGGVICKERK